MVAGRSRNMRLMLILQSYEQLVDVYGKSKAKTICSSIGITIGFSTNCWETLVEWSQRCGKKQVENNGRTTNESLIDREEDSSYWGRVQMYRTPLVLVYWDGETEELVWDLTGQANLERVQAQLS